LEFKKLQGHHTGLMLSEEVFTVLQEYEITAKLLCITCDNASNNGTMMKELSNKLRRFCRIAWDHKAHHIACLNHVLNLAVEAFLKSIKATNLDGTGFNDSDGDDEHEHEENDSDDEEETGLEIEVVEGEGFKETMEKIRKIVKVLP